MIKMTGRSRRPKWISLNFRSLDLVPRTFPFRGGGFTHERGGARIYEPLDGQRSDTRLPVTESLLSACTRRGADTMGRLQVHPVRYIKHEDGGGSVRIRGKITTTWISTLPAILPLLFSFSLSLSVAAMVAATFPDPILSLQFSSIALCFRNSRLISSFTWRRCAVSISNEAWHSEIRSIGRANFPPPQTRKRNIWKNFLNCFTCT